MPVAVFVFYGGFVPSIYNSDWNVSYAPRGVAIQAPCLIPQANLILYSIFST